MVVRIWVPTFNCLSDFVVDPRMDGIPPGLSWANLRIVLGLVKG